MTAPKTIDDYAEEASWATSRWYGRVAHFNEPPQPWISCKEWFKRHWRQFPATSPEGRGTIIENPASGLVGFGREEGE